MKAMKIFILGISLLILSSCNHAPKKVKEPSPEDQKIEKWLRNQKILKHKDSSLLISLNQNIKSYYQAIDLLLASIEKCSAEKYQVWQASWTEKMSDWIRQSTTTQQTCRNIRLHVSNYWQRQQITCRASGYKELFYAEKRLEPYLDRYKPIFDKVLKAKLDKLVLHHFKEIKTLLDDLKVGPSMSSQGFLATVISEDARQVRAEKVPDNIKTLFNDNKQLISINRANKALDSVCKVK